MEIVTFVNFSAIIICLIGRLLHQEKISFQFVIIVLILFYSIRTEYGNDVPAYMYYFEQLSYYSFETFSLIDKEWEPGWLLLNVLFAPFGWQAFITFLTIVQFITIYWMITKYSSRKDYWVIFALYILSSNLFLTDLSMLRQALAMHVCVWSISSILKKKILKAIIIILFATTIHTSAYIAFLLLLIPYISKINRGAVIAGFIGVFILINIIVSVYSNIFSIIFSLGTFEKYEGYTADKANSGTGLWVLFQALTCVWMLYKYPYKLSNLFFIISQSLYTLILPLNAFAPLITRVGMYFNLIGIISFKNLLNIKRDIVGFMLLIITLLMSIRGYFSFFENPVWKDSFSVYRTVFD